MSPSGATERAGATSNRPKRSTFRAAAKEWLSRKIDCARIILLDVILWTLMYILPSSPPVVVGLLYKCLSRDPSYDGVHMSMDDTMAVVADILVAVGICGLICDCIIFARARFSASGGVKSARGDTERVVVKRNLLPTSILNTLTTIRTIGFFVSGIVVANALVWIGLGIQFKPETAVPLIVSISSLCAHAVTFSNRLQHYFKHETVNRLESFLGKTIDGAALHSEGQLAQHIPKLDTLANDPQRLENALGFFQEFADKASLKPSLQMLESLSRNMVNSATMLEFLTGISLTAKEFAQLGFRQTGIPPRNVCTYDATVPSAGNTFMLLDISGKDILSVYGSDGLEGTSNKSMWKEGRNGCFLRFDSKDVAPRARDQRSLLMSFGRNVAGGGEEKLRDARGNVIKNKSRMDFHNMAFLKRHQLVRMHCW